MTKTMRSGLVASVALAAAFANAQGIEVQVNGEQVNFPVQQPVYSNGRVLVPLRGVFEKLGAYVTWHPETDTVRAVKGDTDVRIRIGSRTAHINGSVQTLDVPPRLVRGTTLVPLRFLSESLGANVDWNNEERLVSIQTDGSTVNTTGNRAERMNTESMVVLQEDTVIPVSLNTRLNSATTRAGDRFSATIDADNRDAYLGLPNGAKVEGHVVASRAKKGSDPGVLELEFDRIRMPDGRAVALQGSLISLDNKSVETRSDGTIVARPEAKDNRMVYAGYGAGAGLILGVLTKRPLENAILGGILGYAVGTLSKPQGNPSNVNLDPGTRFGVRLDRELAINFDR